MTTLTTAAVLAVGLAVAAPASAQESRGLVTDETQAEAEQETLEIRARRERRASATRRAGSPNRIDARRVFPGELPLKSQNTTMDLEGRLLQDANESQVTAGPNRASAPDAIEVAPVE